jgi:predicted DNA-binding transcriptional regulator AlpA
MALRIISRAEFRHRQGGISRATEYRKRKVDPAYPKIVRVSRRLTGILEDDADRYIAGLAGRDDRGEAGSE